jgi:hypothetical protein
MDFQSKIMYYPEMLSVVVSAKGRSATAGTTCIDDRPRIVSRDTRGGSRGKSRTDRCRPLDQCAASIGASRAWVEVWSGAIDLDMVGAGWRYAARHAPAGMLAGTYAHPLDQYHYPVWVIHRSLPKMHRGQRGYRSRS